MDPDTSMALTTIIIIALVAYYIMSQKKKDYKKEKQKPVSVPSKQNYVYDPDGSETEYTARQKLKEMFGSRPAVSMLLLAGDMTTEIDLAQATTKGIFVVECKNRNAFITGDAGGDRWLVGNAQNAPMENPIKQNFYHVKAVKDYLKTAAGDIPVFNVVYLMSRGSRIENLDTMEHTKFFTSLRDMESLKDLPDVISKDKADELQELLYAKEATVDELEAHAANVSAKYGH